MNYVMSRKDRRLLAAIEIAETAITQAMQVNQAAIMRKYELTDIEDVTKIKDELGSIGRTMFLRRTKIGKQ